jgi:hypothetical protein
LSARSPLTSHHSVVLAVGSYPSRSTAERDFRAVWALKHKVRVDQVAVAAVEKGTKGWLEIARHHGTAMPLAWGVVPFLDQGRPTPHGQRRIVTRWALTE